MRAVLRLPPALWAVVAAGALVRAHFGLTDHGLHWPDEVFQSLEPAHGLVHGAALLPWEYLDGARSWALPGLFAGLLAAGDAVGLDGPREYLPLVRLAVVAVSAATALSTYALARVAGASRGGAVAGAAAFALAAPFVFFGHRALSEVVAALPVTLGLACALRGGRRWVALGAGLLGLACALRLHTAVVAVALPALLVARRRPREAAEAALVLTACALALGLLDRLTWGTWFGSAREYLRFNLLEDGAARAYGREPAAFYLTTLWGAAPLLTALLVAGALGALRRAPALVAVAALVVGLLSATGHKELRFLLPVVPLLCALAAVGLEALVPARARPHAATALAAAALASGLGVGSLTAGDLGQRLVPAQASAWGQFEDVNELLLAAGERPDLCGLRLEAVDPAFSGGLTYLHRDVPLYGPDEHPVGTYNYVIDRDPAGRARLRRVAAGCRPDPAYEGRLNERAT